MKRLILSVAVALCYGGPVLAQPANVEEYKDGFLALFNDKDFTGWRFSGGKDGTPPKNWSVADGMIRLSGGGAPHLASQWEYDDFDVRFQWRAAKANYNGGFFVRSGRNVGANQINLAQKAAGNLMGGAKGGRAVPELQKPPGEWNEWRVLAIGETLTFWCNGQKAWEVTGFKPARGYLGLQAEGAAIDFKNLRIKELGYEGVGFTVASDTDVSGGVPIKTPVTLGPYDGYTLRMEYKSEEGSKAHVLPRGKQGKQIALAEGPVAKALHKPGEWNYLEVRATKDRGRVWLNGTVVADNLDLGGADAGPIGIVPEGSLRLGAVRVRREK